MLDPLLTIMHFSPTTGKIPSLLSVGKTNILDLGKIHPF